MMQDIFTQEALMIAVRRWLLGLLVMFAGYTYGKLTPEPDESNMRWWIVYARNNNWAKIALVTVIVVGGGLAADYWLYQVLIPRFSENVLIGAATLLMGVLFGGLGFPLGKWATHTDYKAVEEVE